MLPQSRRSEEAIVKQLAPPRAGGHDVWVHATAAHATARAALEVAGAEALHLCVQAVNSASPLTLLRHVMSCAGQCQGSACTAAPLPGCTRPKHIAGQSFFHEASITCASHLHARRADGVPARAGGQAARNAAVWVGQATRAALGVEQSSQPQPHNMAVPNTLQTPGACHLLACMPVKDGTRDGASARLEGAAAAAEQGVVGAHMHAARAGHAVGREGHALPRRGEAWRDQAFLPHAWDVPRIQAAWRAWKRAIMHLGEHAAMLSAPDLCAQPLSASSCWGCAGTPQGGSTRRHREEASGSVAHEQGCSIGRAHLAQGGLCPRAGCLRRACLPAATLLQTPTGSCSRLLPAWRAALLWWTQQLAGARRLPRSCPAAWRPGQPGS